MATHAAWQMELAGVTLVTTRKPGHANACTIVRNDTPGRQDAPAPDARRQEVLGRRVREGHHRGPASAASGTTSPAAQSFRATLLES